MTTYYNHPSSQAYSRHSYQHAAQPSINTPPSRKITFNISSDYKVEKIIGEGSYGIVISATNKVTGQKVAIKKISPFDRTLTTIRTLREIKLLKHFNNHENIINILDIQKPKNYENFKDVYIIQELMMTDLNKLIQYRKLTEEHLEYFTYQILKGLKALHSVNVIHRDLKPSNILINENCDLKICDFGLAREGNNDDNNSDESTSNIGFLTEYVATRWYRAPEIMLNVSQYTCAIDIWSVGCILAEMLTGEALFPGTDYQDQLIRIMDILGTPTGHDFESIKNGRAKAFINSLPFCSKKPLGMIFRGGNPKAIDLVGRMLAFDPAKRIAVDEALQHPYLEQYYEEGDLREQAPLEEGVFSIDKLKNSVSSEELKGMLYREILDM